MSQADEFDQLQRELQDALTPDELDALRRRHSELLDLEQRTRLAEEMTARLDADPTAGKDLDAAREQIRRGDVVSLDDL